MIRARLIHNMLPDRALMCCFHSKLQQKIIDAEEFWLQGLLPSSYQSNATQAYGQLIETRQKSHHKPKDNCFKICIREVIY